MQIEDLKQDKRNYRKHNKKNIDLIKNHKPEWTSQELDIIYKGVYTNKPLFDAIKNKLKKVKYGK